MAMQPEGSERFGSRFGREAGQDPKNSKTRYVSWAYGQGQPSSALD